MQLSKSKSLLAAAALLCAATAGHAANYDVYALANSSSGGTGLDTVTLTAGQSFTVSIGLDDLWSAGALPRWSNADGLVGDRFASGTDESGEAAGTRIGQDFGTHTQDGFTAPYGALVGVIGGSHLLLGTSFAGTAPASGTLKLYYWDSIASDNTQFVTAAVNVSAVPEPTTYGLMLAGLAATAFIARRRQH